jgi:D-xylulose reductase
MSNQASKNISCFLYGPGDARYEESPVPTLTDPHDVLVRIHYVGVCGSDVRDWQLSSYRIFVIDCFRFIFGVTVA